MLLRLLTLVGLLLCVGCGPQVLYDKSVTVTTNDIQPILFGPFQKEGTVSIEVESVGSPVTLYVHPEDQREQIEYAISYEKEPPGIVAGSEAVEKESYKITVPAQTEMAVTLKGTSQEGSEVKLKIIK